MNEESPCFKGRRVAADAENAGGIWNFLFCNQCLPVSPLHSCGKRRLKQDVQIQRLCILIRLLRKNGQFSPQSRTASKLLVFG